MKKTLLKILIVFAVIILVALSYVGIIIYQTQQEHLVHIKEKESIQAITPAKVVVSYQYKKDMKVATRQIEEKVTEDDILAQYQYNNINFISYSEAWYEESLKNLCDELLLNIHGAEIDYLEQVIVIGERDEDAAGMHISKDTTITIAMTLKGLLPDDFSFDMPSPASVIRLYNGDEHTTPESMAIVLSHEYGHHFVEHHFENYSDALLESQYYQLRNDPDKDIKYLGAEDYDWDHYLDNHMWYIGEIAADDYVYLMGSPNTRFTKTYYDSKEVLRLDIRGDDDTIEEYRKGQHSFNQSLHENIALPLPDQVECLAELFYNAINLSTPTYEDRTEDANSIDIKISRRVDEGHRYYKVSWNKPWTSDDVMYTLVAYDEGDKLIGAIKNIDGNEDARVVIGCAVVRTDNYIYWWTSDYWTDFDFLRFRVVITFPDGTAAISPAIDKEF